MPGLIVSGHGSWTPGATPGYVNLSPGQEVHFYQEMLHLLDDESGQAIERRLASALENPVHSFRHLPSGLRLNGILLGGDCPNFTISPPRRLEIIRFEATDEFEQLVPEADMTLAQIIDRYPEHTIYWGACVAVRLKDVGGAMAGVNTGWDGTQNRTTYVSRADIARDAQRADYYSEESRISFEASALTRAALPSGSVCADYDAIIALLWESHEAGGAEGMAYRFATDAALTPEIRRGLLMNDVYRGWLEECGLCTHRGYINDRIVSVRVPAFWTADNDAAALATRELFLHSRLSVDGTDLYEALYVLVYGRADVSATFKSLDPQHRTAFLAEENVLAWLTEAGYQESTCSLQ
ncbi:putative adhesin [Streptomyces vinaceus]|uniref:putative adhesin n=1 Tax=Streptomyces vinaceus TaxID=1960 RepID=UPI003815AE64